MSGSTVERVFRLKFYVDVRSYCFFKKRCALLLESINLRTAGIFMKSVVILFLLCSVSLSNAAEKANSNLNNVEITTIIQNYSKISGQKFIVDPSVRGKISIFQKEPATVEESFNQLSSALAMNGYAISKQGDTMMVKSARNIQRDLIEVSPEVPSLKPERMYTWIYTAKNMTADSINRNLRILVSKDGELSANSETNQLVITDWVSNINRIVALMKEIDKPVEAGTAKLVELAKKQQEDHRKDQSDKK